MKEYKLIVALSFISLGGIAQVQPVIKDTTKPAAVVVIPPSPPAPDTAIHVIEQPIVRNTVQIVYDNQRYSHATSPGFRVQINFGQERNAINETKSEFTEKYPGVTSYITYKQPYFRLSVGDFRTRLDAYRLLKTVKKDYPGAFIVADKIMPPPL